MKYRLRRRWFLLLIIYWRTLNRGNIVFQLLERLMICRNDCLFCKYVIPKCWKLFERIYQFFLKLQGVREVSVKLLFSLIKLAQIIANKCYLNWNLKKYFRIYLTKKIEDLVVWVAVKIIFSQIFTLIELCHAYDD